jgi:hypothetical protein
MTKLLLGTKLRAVFMIPRLSIVLIRRGIPI